MPIAGTPKTRLVNGQRVDAATGLPFGQAPATPAVAAPVQPQEDPNRQLVQKAAAAGVKVSDLGGLIARSDPSESRNRIAQEFGYGSFQELAESAFAPSTSTQKLYRDAFRSSGLADIKKKIEARREDLNRATSAINDNPWLSEASRSGKLGELQKLAYADISQFNDLYTQGLAEVGRITQQSAADLAEDRATRQQQLNFMLKLAEEEDQIAQEKLLAGYLPDYFDAIPDEAEKPITLAEGASLVDPVTGKVLYKAPKTYAPGTGSPSKTEVAAAQKASDRAAALAAIDSRVGTDGFLSDADFEKMAQAWARAGYADFDKEFGAFRSPNNRE